MGLSFFVGNQFGYNLAKLSTLGSGRVDAAWRPNPSYAVTALALRGDGLFVGGWFDSIGGAFRTNLAMISAEGTGAADSAWQANVVSDPYNYGGYPAYSVVALALHGNNLFVGGNFTNIGGFSRNNLARVTATGVGEVARVWQENANASVSALIAVGNEIYAGGGFTNIRGVARYGLANLPAADPAR